MRIPRNFPGIFFDMSIEPTTFAQSLKLTVMRIKRTIPKVSRERAIEIASNHNCVSMEVARNYTDSELKEVLRVLKLKANF